MNKKGTSSFTVVRSSVSSLAARRVRNSMKTREKLQRPRPETQFFRGPPLATVDLRPAITRPPKNPESMVWRWVVGLLVAYVIIATLTLP